MGNKIKSFNLLLVDDEEKNISSLKLLIEQIFDISIYTASSGLDAMGILLKQDIDLIISDIQMPNMDGFEFAKLIKKKNKTKDIPIIFLTAIYDSLEYKKQGFDLGAIDYITKPIDRIVLTSKIKIFIQIFEMQKSLELKNKELEEKNRLLVHQSRLAAMGEMLSLIAHQWRQPLSTISTILAKIKIKFSKDLVQNGFDEDYTNMMNALNYMSRTVDDFANFFKDDIRFVEVEIGKIVQKPLSLMSPILKENTIDIDVQYLDSKSKVFTDVLKIEQIILNLIKNSMDAILLLSSFTTLWLPEFTSIKAIA